MGLDMYLYSVPKIEEMELDDILSANVHLGTLEKENNDLYQKVKGYIKHFEEFEYTWDSLMSEVAYWRKANQIHHWFVENVQQGKDDCRIYEVKLNHLILLYNYCDMVLRDEVEPWEVLPTWPGFFFGDTGYGRFYFKEIRETHHTLDYLIQNFPFQKNYLTYQSSW